MLTMKRGRDCVKFEVVDGEVESVVTLLPEDDEETLLRKMKRVIALVESEAPRLAPRLGEPPFLTEVVPGERARATMEPPEIPERLKGQVEMEEAAPTTGNGWASLGDGEGLPSA